MVLVVESSGVVEVLLLAELELVVVFKVVVVVVFVSQSTFKLAAPEANKKLLKKATIPSTGKGACCVVGLKRCSF